MYRKLTVYFTARLILSGLFLTGSIFGQSIEAAGRIEGRVGLLSSGNQENDNLVHMERVNLGIQQNLDFMNLSYTLTGGGLYQSSSTLDTSVFTPEYQVRAQMTPAGKMQIELFSYSQQRNPMHFTRDTIRHQEQVSGLQIQSPLGHGRVLAAYGTRLRTRDNEELNGQFMKLQLEQRILGMQVRVRGEQDLSSVDSDPEEKRSTIAIQWYGSPIRGLSWTGLNSLYEIGGQEFLRIYQRMNYRLSDKTNIWAHYRNQEVAYGDERLNTEHFDVDFRRKVGKHFALQALVEGSKVKPENDGLPRYHWRAYMSGLHFHVGERYQALGVFQAGYKESYRFGSGTDLRYELEARAPLFKSRNLGVHVTNILEGEQFTRQDVSGEDPRHDIENEFRLNLDLWPGRMFQVANVFKVLNHTGTDLEFSSDTLRNAMTHNIQFKFIQRRLRASLDHLTISEQGEGEDTRLHLNSRLTYHVAPGKSVNLVSLYRYQSDLYPEYLWLTGFLKINMQHFDWALELQAQGHPDTVFDDNLAVWMRFVRQL